MESDNATARRVMLLMSPATYRAGAFVRAAEQLDIGIVSVLDMPDPLRDYWQRRHGVDFAAGERAVDEIVELARAEDVGAILSVDDSATELAALAAARLGLAHNAPSSATAARDKLVMRRMLQAGGVPVPEFHDVAANADPTRLAQAINYPCVVKPLRLSGSRGVIRANDPGEFVAAFTRLTRMLRSDGADLEQARVLIEAYLPGDEVALEGLLTNGSLRVLALFDKPDPLVGPFFEETIYVTPSRLPAGVQTAIADATAAAARALGLREGPVHAELRVNERGAWLIEMAGRSIGGLCSTILSFGAGLSLEELILRHAIGDALVSTERQAGAVGVMMIPIPRGGLLRRVDGVAEACALPGIDGIEITAKLNYPITPLPEGASYLGFIFARGETPAAVEAALREAHARLDIGIDPLLPLQTRPAAAAGTN
jgi:biotin carboxylase